ncbi:hypothetical protein TNCV_3477031 [Trichonephila clavipes]|nr:hypothetical protein TNCV_3477031 [Trichonephila clavipes]
MHSFTEVGQNNTFLPQNSVSCKQGKCKNCNCNFGDRRPPITPPLSQMQSTQKTISINARREFIVHLCLCRHTAKEVCGSSVTPVESGFLDASTMSWLLVGPVIPHLPRNLLNCKIKTLSPRETVLVMNHNYLVKKKNLALCDLRRRLQAPTFHSLHLS